MVAASFRLFWLSFCFYTYKLRKYLCIVHSDCTLCMPLFDKKCAKMSVFYVKTVKIRWQLGVSTPHLRLWSPVCQMGAPLICGRDDLFLVFTWFWAENWTSADVMTLKELVLLLRSENIVTLVTMDNAKIFPQLVSKSRGLAKISEKETATIVSSRNCRPKLGFSTLLQYIAKGGLHGETKKKTGNCDIINIKIKSLLYSLEYIEV